MWNQPPPGYVDLKAAAEITGYSEQTVALKAKLGEIPHLPQKAKGGRWFFKPEELRAWLGIDQAS